MKNQETGRSSAGAIALVRGVLRALWDEILSDHARLVAAGLAYYAVFGLLPALAGAAAIWGQFGGFATLQHSIQTGGGEVVPAETMRLLKQFMTSVPEGLGGGLTLLLNVGVVILTCYQAAGGLLTALNIVYDLTETRSYLRRAIVTLAIGLSGLILVFIALALLALAPWLAARQQQSAASALVWLRWPGLGLIFFLALIGLFRFGPNRDRAPWRTIVTGAGIAMLLWLAASVGVSIYVDHITSFGRLYGSVGAFAVVLLWFYALSLAILTGGEIDALLASGEPRRSRRMLKSDRSPR